jgi:hypothetical protein
MADFINVEYRNIDGVHVFTSDEARGLYVACADPREAFQSVSGGISLHYEFNEKREVKVSPSMTVEEFLGWIGADNNAVEAVHSVVAGKVSFQSIAA